MSTYAIKADKFFLPAGPQLGGYLMVEDGVFGAWQADEPSCEIKDYTGSWIAPGMVDTHIHGFYNHSTTDNDPEGIDISSTELARRGTTSWLPTTFTDGVEQIKDACAAIAQADEGRGPDFCGARIQGIYLEGPFFTMKHVGAQNPAYLIDPSEEVFDQWQEAAGGRIVKSAMAAERDGAVAYAAALNAKGVVTSIGHSDATYDECVAAINAGASCFTHTYNGQRGLHHREPGVVGAAMSTPETYAEVICDGKHVNPAAIKARASPVRCSRLPRASRTSSTGVLPAPISPFVWQPRCRLVPRTSRISAAASCRVATPTLSCSTTSLPSLRPMLAARASATHLPSNDRKRRRARICSDPPYGLTLKSTLTVTAC